MSIHRLLKRKQAITFLTPFETLLPVETKIALLRADNRFFAGIGEWDKKEISGLIGQHNQTQFSTINGLVFQPLTVGEKFVGTLVYSESTETAVIEVLYNSLIMLLAQSQEKRDVASEALERYREINLLYDIAETIGATLDIKAIPKLVLSEATKAIQAELGAVFLPHPDNDAQLEVKSSFGSENPKLLLDDPIGYLVKQVYETGHPDIYTALSLASSLVEQVLCVPLKMQDKVMGVVMLGRASNKQIFTASDEKLLMALASQTAIAIDKAWLHKQEIKRQRIDKELAVGQQIQLSLLPESSPEISGWEFASVYQSARQVGGDFYNIFELPGSPRRIGMLIADVTGKGVPAALFMAFSRTIIHTTSLHGENPATVLQQANRLIHQDNRSKIFLTAFYAILEIETGRLTYASAGHNWPLWVPAESGECRELSAVGFLLGAFDEIELEEREIQVKIGDVLAFFTDGVPEAMDVKGSMFGEERLQTTLAQSYQGGAKDVLQATVDTVQKFTGNTPQSDDFTLFVVKRVD
ncbi:SpoIIE family protein phosphatase [Anaerolineales bacterium HSG6]|nr:SpoIIE family protein phosphatase [Anaerolineales bacterium HSG6]